MQPGQFEQEVRARSSESFIARLEQQKKAWSEQVGVVSPGEEEEELGPPAAKQAKLEKDEGMTTRWCRIVSGMYPAVFTLLYYIRREGGIRFAPFCSS